MKKEAAIMNTPSESPPSPVETPAEHRFDASLFQGGVARCKTIFGDVDDDAIELSDAHLEMLERSRICQREDNDRAYTRINQRHLGSKV